MLALLSVEAEVTHEPVHELRGSYSLESAYEDSLWRTIWLLEASLIWKFSSTSIKFNLTINSSIVSGNKWYGIGLKDPHVGEGMQDGEYFVIKNLYNPKFQHMNTFRLDTKGGRPSNNTINSFKPISHSFFENGDLNVIWEKPLNKAIKEQTLDMITDKNYTILSAFGNVTNGIMQPHNENHFKETLSLDKWGKLTLRCGVLQWRISENKVDFRLHAKEYCKEVPSYVGYEVQWYGVAFKEPSENISMIDAQYFLVTGMPSYTRFFVMNTDGYTENRFPQESYDAPITSSSISYNYKGATIATWTLSLNSPFSNGFELKAGNEYTVLFAFGIHAYDYPLNYQGMTKHIGTSRGYRNITLSNDFSGNTIIPPYKTGKEILKYDTVLEWHVSEAAVDFRLTFQNIPFTVGWCGIGLKKPLQEPLERVMIDAQYFIVNRTYDFSIFNVQPSVLAMNTFHYPKNAHPQEDILNPIMLHSSEVFEEIGEYQYTGIWTVPFNASFNNTVELKPGGQYTLLFACGQHDIDGKMMKHNLTNYVNITLSNDFFGNATETHEGDASSLYYLLLLSVSQLLF